MVAFQIEIREDSTRLFPSFRPKMVRNVVFLAHYGLLKLIGTENLTKRTGARRMRVVVGRRYVTAEAGAIGGAPPSGCDASIRLC
jgi:hypothetical protein